MTPHSGWFLIVARVTIAEFGILWLVAPLIPWLGTLPGDIRIERKNFTFYFPIATCIVISVLLTGILKLIRLFRGKAP